MPKTKPEIETRATPAALGFTMPAEWERHEATWLIWPHNPVDWADKVDTVRWVYGEIVRKICPAESVRILVNSKADEKVAHRYLTRAGADLDRVQFVLHPTTRGWTRDTGPIFVKQTGAVVGRASRLPPARRALELSTAGETPAPLP